MEDKTRAQRNLETDEAINKLIAEGMVTRKGNEIHLTEKAWSTMTSIKPKEGKT